jgi:sulfate adenylyltransferase subunit 1 (EFTu-like GTPase family)
MDLVDYHPVVFERIQADYLEFAVQLGIGDVRFIPLLALTGEMVVGAGSNSPGSLICWEMAKVEAHRSDRITV